MQRKKNKFKSVKYENIIVVFVELYVVISKRRPCEIHRTQ